MTEAGLSIAILAGGDSKRMGAAKALQPLGGKPLLQHVIDAMGTISDDIFIVGNEVESLRSFELPVCGDLHATRSSLVGVYAAVAASRRERCLVVSCDMPFADPALALRMLDYADGYDAVVPVSPAGMEPLFAIYSRRCLETMEDFIQREEFKILAVLDSLKVRWVTPAEMQGLRDPALTFFNVNTPGELQQAETLLHAIDTVAAAPVSSQAPLLCFVGNKNSGKTTLVTALVGHLNALGLNVACIKHDVHGFAMDREGTDTWRFADAGARQVIISTPERFARIASVAREVDLLELRELIGGSADIILAEGYKRSGADKIEVHGRNDPDELVCDEEDLLAVVSDAGVGGASLRRFDHDDVAALADFIIRRYQLSPPGGGAP